MMVGTPVAWLTSMRYATRKLTAPATVASTWMSHTACPAFGPSFTPVVALLLEVRSLTEFGFWQARKSAAAVCSATEEVTFPGAKEKAIEAGEESMG